MNTLNNQSSPNYRTWPMFLLAFIRLFYVSIFERALSNYLLFDIGIRESVLIYYFLSVAGKVTDSRINLRHADAESAGIMRFCHKELTSAIDSAGISPARIR